MAKFNWDDYEEAKNPLLAASEAVSAQDSKKGAFNWDDYAVGKPEDPNTSPVTAVTTGLIRGAVPFASSLAGIGKAGMDAVTGVRGPLAGGSLDDVLDDYRQTRDSFRHDTDAAAEAHPKTAFASTLAGGLANPLFKDVHTLPEVAAAGAVQALGDSKADLTKGELKDSAVDAGLGAATGLAGYAVGKAIPKIYGGAQNLGKKALTVFGPSDEAIAARLSGKAQPGADSYPKLAENMGGTLKKFGDKISALNEAASQTLSGDPTIPKPYVTQALEDAISGLQFHGETVGEAAEKAEGTLKSLLNKFSKLPDVISEQDLKRIIGIVDQNTKWADQGSELTNNLLKGIRHQFDQTLKSQNAQYKQAMVPLAVQTKILNNVRKQFNFEHVPNEGLVPTETTAGKLQNSLRENKFQTQKNLGLLERHTGDDYLKSVKDYAMSKQFQVPVGSTERSTRRTMAGAGVGALTGSVFAPGMGTTVGAALGAGAGSMMDRYGGKAVGSLLDGIVKVGNSKAMGKFAPLIDAAAKRGPEALAVLGTMLGSNPEFKKALEDATQ